MKHKQLEQWLPVVGYENYYKVSSVGRVWSIPRWVVAGKGGKRKTGGFLKPNPTGEYLYVSLFISGMGGKHRPIHQLVLEAFVGPCPPGMQSCHNNGKSQDNRLTNLRWDTPVNNQQDRRKHGTYFMHGEGPRGATHHLSRLSELAVRRIKRLYACGSLSQSQLARQYSVSQPSISAIVLGKTRRRG